MRIFAVKDYEMSFDVDPCISPIYFVSGESYLKLEEGAKGFAAMHYEGPPGRSTDSIKLSILSDNGNGDLFPEADEIHRTILRLIRVEGALLRQLKEFYDEPRVTVKIQGLRWPDAQQLDQFRQMGLRDTYPREEEEVEDENTLWTNEMEASEEGGQVCYKEQVSLPAVWFAEVARVGLKFNEQVDPKAVPYHIRITVTIEISPQIPKMMAAKKLLEESIDTDAVLVGACGTEIKCHRIFLSATSAELGNNFQNDFKESKSGRLELVDMTKEGIESFLQYIYYCGTKGPEKYSAIALELLQAAHKYNVVPLEKEMKRILCLKGNYWYDVADALKLFLFARNVEGYEDVTKKSTMVLKSKFNELQSLEEYKALFFKEPETAMQLCGSAFSI